MLYLAVQVQEISHTPIVFILCVYCFHFRQYFSLALYSGSGWIWVSHLCMFRFFPLRCTNDLDHLWPPSSITWHSLCWDWTDHMTSRASESRPAHGQSLPPDYQGPNAFPSTHMARTNTHTHTHTHTLRDVMTHTPLKHIRPCKHTWVVYTLRENTDTHCWINIHWLQKMHTHLRPKISGSGSAGWDH